MDSRKFDAVCLSDCCCDLIFEGLPQIPANGGEEYCEAFRITSGGGANTPMGLARLGLSVGYVSAIGDDSFGDMIATRLRESGTNDEFVQRRPDSSTWVSAVLSTRNDRAFASYAGTPVEFDETLAAKILPLTQHLHSYTYYGLKFPQLTDWCRQYGVTVSFDSAAAPDVSLKDLEPLLKGTAVFTPNSDEACAITKSRTPEGALRVLSGLCEYVVVTCGRDGCLAAKNNDFWRATSATIPAAVDSNGAGDMFAAGLLSAYLSGKSVEEQLAAASASGSLAVTYAGGMSDQFTAQAVQELMASVIVEKL